MKRLISAGQAVDRVGVDHQPPCDWCGGPVASTEAVLVFGRVYHCACFDIPTAEADRRQLLYGESFRLVRRPRCEGCGKTVLFNWVSTEFGRKVWHRECERAAARLKITSASRG